MRDPDEKSSRDTPVHAILKLDDAIVSEKNKLLLTEFFYSKNAPIDSPNSDNIWPIHLAARNENKSIIQFLIDRNVGLDRRDGSNNTPLHYAIYGRDTTCPIEIKPKTLTKEEQKQNKDLKEKLDDNKKLLMQYIATDKDINEEMLNLTSTLLKIPEMYKNMGKELEEKIDKKTNYPDVIESTTNNFIADHLRTSTKTYPEETIEQQVENDKIQLDNSIQSVISNLEDYNAHIVRDQVPSLLKYYKSIIDELDSPRITQKNKNSIIKNEITDIIEQTEDKIIKLQTLLINLNTITNATATDLRTNYHYYIGQIYLPAMVIAIIRCIKAMKNIIDSYHYRELTEFISTKNYQETHVINILNLFDSSKKDLALRMQNIYFELINLFGLHNQIIDTLNKSSAHSVLDSLHEDSKYNLDKQLFINSLEHIPESIFPKNISNVKESNYDELADSYLSNLNIYYNRYINEYKLPEIYNREGKTDKFPKLVANTLPTQRIGQVSHSPYDDLNYQYNFFLDEKSQPIYRQVDIPIEGQFITSSRFKDAFIAVSFQSYTIHQNDIPLSVRIRLDTYVRLKKQQIVQFAVNKIISDRNSGIYVSLEKLSVDTPVNKTITELTNNLMNEYIKYTVRRIIVNWIENIASKRNTLSSSDLEFFASEQKIVSQPPVADIDIFEENPGKILQKDPNLIHYLYNLESNNYYSCRLIDPDLIKLLITSETINAQNYDGNTPLHIATSYVYHVGLVEILLCRGANAFSFKNKYGQTPISQLIEDLKRHTKYSLDNFSDTYQKLLISRLLDDRYSNSVIKNADYAVKINLSMYNHMFYTYLQNYRYNLTYELKQQLDQLHGAIL